MSLSANHEIQLELDALTKKVKKLEAYGAVPDAMTDDKLDQLRAMTYNYNLLTYISAPEWIEEFTKHLGFLFGLGLFSQYGNSFITYTDLSLFRCNDFLLDRIDDWVLEDRVIEETIEESSQRFGKVFETVKKQRQILKEELLAKPNYGKEEEDIISLMQAKTNFEEEELIQFESKHFSNPVEPTQPVPINKPVTLMIDPADLQVLDSAGLVGDGDMTAIKIETTIHKANSIRSKLKEIGSEPLSEHGSYRGRSDLVKPEPGLFPKTSSSAESDRSEIEVEEGKIEIVGEGEEESDPIRLESAQLQEASNETEIVPDPSEEVDEMALETKELDKKTEMISKPDFPNRVEVFSKTAESSGKPPKPSNRAEATGHLKTSRSDVGGSKYEEMNMSGFKKGRDISLLEPSSDWKERSQRGKRHAQMTAMKRLSQPKLVSAKFAGKKQN